MKLRVLLTLSASLMAFHAMAADCIQEICVGDKVISRYNQVSVVKEITDQGKVRIIQDSQLAEVFPSELSDEIKSPKLPVNKVVLDQYNYQGKVIAVFRNGVIQYRRFVESSDTFTNYLSPEVEQLDHLKEGTDVMDQYNYKGSVKRLFENGQVVYRRNVESNDTVTRASTLSHKVTNYEDLTAGSEIIDNYNYQGKVSAVYADGRISYRRFIESSETVTRASSLTPKVLNVDGLSRGTRIIDNYNYIGAVLDTFKDGRISYKRDVESSATVTRSSSLVKEVSEFRDLKVGAKGIDQYNYYGQIVKVFADGRILFKRNVESSASILREISPEIDTHSVYKKDTKYAGESVVGNPEAFFADGRVMLKGQVSRQLYEAVDELDEITKETELVTLDGQKFGKAVEIYANGVVVLGDEKNTVKKVYNYTKNQGKEQKTTLRILAHRLSHAVHYNDKGILQVTLFPESDLEPLKKDLGNFIRSKESGHDKDETKKMLKLLGAEGIIQSDKFLLSVSPASLNEEVKAILDQDQKEYVEADLDDAQASTKSIIVKFSKGLLKSTCSIQIKDNGKTIKAIDVKVGRSDTEECLDKLRD